MGMIAIFLYKDNDLNDKHLKTKSLEKSRLEVTFIAFDDYSPGNAHSKLALSTEQRAFFNTDIILAS